MSNVWQDAITQYLNEPAPDPSVAPNAPPTAGVVTPSASTTAGTPTEKLPTTGVDASVLVLIAVALVVLGVVALMAGRRRHRTAG